MPNSKHLNMSIPQDCNIRLYYSNLDHIFAPQKKEQIANYPEIWLSAARFMQANIIQACLQFKAIYR